MELLWGGGGEGFGAAGSCSRRPRRRPFFKSFLKQIYDLKCIQELQELLCQDVALQYHHITLYGSAWSGDDILI